MSAEREMLELAAKAYWAGEIDDVVSVEWNEESQSIIYTHASNQDHNGNDWALLWNPLTDDGDALRLAAKLKLNVMQGDFSVRVTDEAEIDDVSFVPDESQRLYAIRESIVRAAAEIGKDQP
jgi:hypothetical protein